MCTNFHIKTKNNAVIVGRSMDNELLLPPAFYIHPRNKPLSNKHVSLTHNKGIESQSSVYGYVGVNINSLPSINEIKGVNLRNIIVDGMNEKGLSAGFLYMPGTKYQKPADENSDIRVHFLCHWVLANYATVDEVKEKLPNHHVCWYPGLDALFPFYLAVVDNTGQSIVIEFKDGNMLISDNLVGVSTNEPWFDWHLENLNNYAFIHPYTQKSFIMGEHKVSPYEGGGALCIPNQSSSVGRFIRTAYQKHYLIEQENADDAFNAVTHMLNSIDHPPGMILDTENANEPTDGKVDVTRWAAIKNLTDGVFALRIYNNMRFRALDLRKIDFDKVNAQILELPILPPFEYIEPK
ncbi:linear amide C-N hydrolase [Morganella psychrotolerans]|uniref:linear amide C-N hydrolase n=1 Tax=Morganella psychrotolerans TaxID=368603 RepID=UPI0039B093FC